MIMLRIPYDAIFSNNLVLFVHLHDTCIMYITHLTFNAPGLIGKAGSVGSKNTSPHLFAACPYLECSTTFLGDASHHRLIIPSQKNGFYCTNRDQDAFLQKNFYWENTVIFQWHRSIRSIASL